MSISFSLCFAPSQHRFLVRPPPYSPNPRHNLLPSSSSSLSCSCSSRLDPISSSSSTKPQQKPSLSLSCNSSLLNPPSQFLLLPPHCYGGDNGGGGNNNNNNNNNGRGWGWGWGWWRRRWPADDPFDPDGWWKTYLPLFLLLLFLESPALARACARARALANGVWEVRGGQWTRLVPDAAADSFVVVVDEYDDGVKSFHRGLESCGRQCRDLFLNLMLPEGYPNSVSSDYLQYSLWRGLQGIASQISGVLATQSLLYAVGLGKGAIPTAAAVNWVLKDGIGYLSKILLSNFGRHFDVHPKGWRLFADLLENSAYGLEIMTPAFPQFFVLIGAVAGAGRSAAALIQAATRSCFFAGFAVQRNSAEVIAKGEAQGMVSKFFGIMLGIALANYIGSSTTLALASFSAVTGFHMYCNLRSYQSIQLRTLNPYRASLVFSEYLLSGGVPRIKEVNDEEPLFPGLPFVNLNTYTQEPSGTLSGEARNAAAEICRRLQLGCKLSEVVRNKEDAFAVFDLFRNEGYMLIENKGRFCVILREGCSPQDMLKSLFHINYLFWLERNVRMESRSISDECKPGGRLQISLDYVQREFSHVRRDGLQGGWLTDDGLIARPLPNRIRLGYAESDLPS